MTDEELMRRALALAEESAREGEVPVAALSRWMAASSAVAETDAKQTKPRWPTPSWRRSARPAGRLEAGGCGNARCM